MGEVMHVVVAESLVTIETAARGLLAAAAHDLRIEAPIASGESEGDDRRCAARFLVANMKVAAARRHGTSDWHDPSASDARDIEGRIRDQVFEGQREVLVEARLAEANGGRASGTITTNARRTQTVDVPVRIEREGGTTKVHGRCELSLEALGAGKVRIPLGAIKLEDRIVVTFDVVLR